MSLRAILVVLVLAVMPALAWAQADDGKTPEGPQETERTIAAQSAVTVTVCMLSGNVSVRGWDKNEVTARSEDGVQIQLIRADSSDDSKPATRVEVLLLDKDDVRRARSTCQASSDVELNVPRGATVHVQTRDGNISIADVATAYAGSQNGDIELEHVSQAAEVGTIGGNICIKESAGRMDLNSAGGGVAATNVRPVDPGDTFEASTVSGDIELQQVSYSQLNVRTVNGNMSLTGPLARGARYGINTMSGDVTLALPADASFQLNAKISSGGDIITDFPLTLLSQSATAAKPVSASSTPEPAESAAPATPALDSPAAAPVAIPAPDSPAPKAPVATPAPVGATPNPPVATAPATVAVAVAVEPVIAIKKSVKVHTKVIVAPYTLRRVNAICGSGDAIISVASFSGTLHLQKN